MDDGIAGACDARSGELACVAQTSMSVYGGPELDAGL